MRLFLPNRLSSIEANRVRNDSDPRRVGEQHLLYLPRLESEAADAGQEVPLSARDRPSNEEVVSFDAILRLARVKNSRSAP